MDEGEPGVPGRWRGLQRRPANHVPLSPVSFLLRAGELYADRVAIVHGDERVTYGVFLARCRRLASALTHAGVAPGDTVAVLAPNIPAVLEAHYGVPMAGAVLCALNYRLDAAAIGYILRHAAAAIVLVDREFLPLAQAAAASAGIAPRLVVIHDPEAPDAAASDRDYARFRDCPDYARFRDDGTAADALRVPDDEWSPIALGYTSGTTGHPKGVVTHHRGAYLNAAAMALEFELGPRSVFLWTLPMFHCNGWCMTWSVCLVGGTHVCLRRVEPARVFALIAEHRVSHLCGAPVVLGMLVHAPEEQRRSFAHAVTIMTGGAAPPSATIARMAELGVTVRHLYGLTETYGPSMVNAWQPALEAMPPEERARFLARQGVQHAMMEDCAVVDAWLRPVPSDGATVGELVLRGNTVMMGYLGDPDATEAALAGGWFRTGDLAVRHPDGYVEVTDRLKDVIISGGENIGSIEVEDVLYRHPDVIEAAVVAAPDAHWGEVPHAFVTLREGATADPAALIAWCRERPRALQVPAPDQLRRAAQDRHRQGAEIPAARRTAAGCGRHCRTKGRGLGFRQQRSGPATCQGGAWEERTCRDTPAGCCSPASLQPAWRRRRWRSPRRPRRTRPPPAPTRRRITRRSAAWWSASRSRRTNRTRSAPAKPPRCAPPRATRTSSACSTPTPTATRRSRSPTSRA